MLDNILEYAVSDAFVQLWMTAYKQNGAMRFKEHWREELVSQFADPNDVPDAIIIEDLVYHTNNTGAFHFGNSKEPTVSFSSMRIIWGEKDEEAGKDTDSFQLNRDVGPARIILSDVKKWHNEGIIHRRRGDAIMCKQATYTWAKGGEYVRSGGPFHLSVRGIQADGDNGTVTNIRLSGLVPTWATVNKRKLGQTQVRNVIRQYKLAVDLLAFDNVFVNVEDEMVFLTEMAE